MKSLVVGVLLIATAASAQTFAPGSATFPSPPLGRHFLDQPVAQCVVATPVPGNPNAVLLTPCAWPAPPVSVTPPIVTPPVAAPKEPEPKEPVVLRIEVVPVPAIPAGKATPLPAPKAAPKKVCPCP